MSPSDSKKSIVFYWSLYAVLLLALFLLGLSKSLLFDVDEGAFTEATREMLASHDWGHTTLNGLDRFDKPIGVYWFQALSASFFGLNEFAFRFPSAISGWLASLALSYFAYCQWGSRASVTAGVISATSLGPWAMSRTATADALLGLLFVLIFLDLTRAVLDRKSWAGRRVALWIALGLLVKGPVAVLIPAATLLFFGLVSPQSRAQILHLLSDSLSWIILLFVSLPWYIYAYARHGQAFIDGFILKHNVDRFMGSLEGHSGHWSYFLIALPFLWMPWSVFFVKAIYTFRLDWQKNLLKFSWIWFLFVFCFFTFANTKLPHYLLYAQPAVCLLLTYASLAASQRTWLLAVFFALIGVTVLLVLPDILYNNIDLIKDAYYSKLMAVAEAPKLKVWLLGLLLLFYGVASIHFVWRKSIVAHGYSFFGLGFIFLAIFQAFVLSVVVLPWWSRTLQSPVYELAQIMRDNESKIVQWGVHVPSFSTYRQQETPQREPLSGEMALVKNTKPSWPSDWKVVEVRGPLSIVKSNK